MTIIKVLIKKKKKNYTIKIGSSLFLKNQLIYPLKVGSRVMLITNNKISAFWKDKIICHLSDLGIIVDQLTLPDGEQHKTLNSLNIIITTLIEHSHNRKSTLIALGGGVIGDLTGFAASVYQRGINYIQIPTTLLAQVDAAIGGKTAVNHLLAKNMIGSFWQPIKVIIDTDFLSTLPKNEFISGMAEVIKYAIAFDSCFFEWLEKYYQLVLKLDNWALMYCIKKCCEIKAKIVSADERENSCRVLLNLGHTYGHAIESFTQYNKWSHGQSISVGIVIASYTSYFLKKISIEDVNRIISLIKNIGLPLIGPKNMKVSSYLSLMKRDKKNLCTSTLRLVLPVKIGKAKVFENISESIIIDAINKCVLNT